MPGLTGTPLQGVSSMNPSAGVGSVANNFVLDSGDPKPPLRQSTGVAEVPKIQQFLVQGASSPRGDGNSNINDDAMRYTRDIGVLADTPLSYNEHNDTVAANNTNTNTNMNANHTPNANFNPNDTFFNPKPPVVIVLPASMSISGVPSGANGANGLNPNSNSLQAYSMTDSSVGDYHNNPNPYPKPVQESQDLVKSTLENLRSRIANRPLTKTNNNSNSNANDSRDNSQGQGQKPASPIKGINRGTGVVPVDASNLNMSGNKINIPTTSTIAPPPTAILTANANSNPVAMIPLTTGLGSGSGTLTRRSIEHTATGDAFNPNNINNLNPNPNPMVGSELDDVTSTGNDSKDSVPNMKIQVRGKGGSIIITDSTYNDNFTLVQNNNTTNANTKPTGKSKGQGQGQSFASKFGSQDQEGVQSSDNLLLDDTVNNSMNTNTNTANTASIKETTSRGSQLSDQTAYFNHYSSNTDDGDKPNPNNHTSVMSSTAISSVLKPTK